LFYDGTIEPDRTKRTHRPNPMYMTMEGVDKEETHVDKEESYDAAIEEEVSRPSGSPSWRAVILSIVEA
jgi:hypothetical protein